LVGGYLGFALVKDLCPVKKSALHEFLSKRKRTLEQKPVKNWLTIFFIMQKALTFFVVIVSKSQNPLPAEPLISHAPRAWWL